MSSTVFHFSTWLKSHENGCLFLKKFTPNDRAEVRSDYLILSSQKDRGLGNSEVIETLIDSSTRAVILIYPDIITQEGVINFFSNLKSKSNRWKFENLNAPEVGDFRHLAVKFETKERLSAIPACFGPFGTLPITRRAPYFALGLWANGYKNEFEFHGKTKLISDQRLSFPNMPHDLTSQEAFTLRFQQTHDYVNKLYSGKYPKKIRDLSFSFEHRLNSEIDALCM